MREFAYLGDRVSAAGECEAAVTARTRRGRVECRECVELPYGRRFPVKRKVAVYSSYVRPPTLYGSEAWRLELSEMASVQRTDRSMVRAMCGIQLAVR